MQAAELVANAQANAEQIVTDARNFFESTVTEARERADAMLAGATWKPLGATADSQDRAEFLQSDAERKHSEVMTAINQQRTVLEGRLEQLHLRAQYRTRLKTYLESQLGVGPARLGRSGRLRGCRLQLIRGSGTHPGPRQEAARC